ncbi:MAG: acylphosphatase [Phycisphaerales bacterium]|nr:acylphosphatase [Phycisphaerales bacterium]
MPTTPPPASEDAPAFRLRIRFSGRVQGVGFRATTHAVASDHRVTGWVRNEPDGTVLAEVQGEADEVHAMLSELRLRMSRNIMSEQADPIGAVPGESRFEIRR